MLRAATFRTFRAKVCAFVTFRRRALENADTRVQELCLRASKEAQRAHASGAALRTFRGDSSVEEATFRDAFRNPRSRRSVAPYVSNGG